MCKSSFKLLDNFFNDSDTIGNCILISVCMVLMIVAFSVLDSVKGGIAPL